MPLDKLTQQHRDERRRAGQTNSLLRGLGKEGERKVRAKKPGVRGGALSESVSPYDPDQRRYGLSIGTRGWKDWD